MPDNRNWYEQAIGSLRGGGIAPEVGGAELAQRARTAGLLRAGLGLMAASGPSLKPHGLGQDIAQGLLAGQQGYRDVVGGYLGLQQARRQAVLGNAKLQAQQLKAQRVAQQQQLAQRILSQGASSGGLMPASTANGGGANSGGLLGGGASPAKLWALNQVMPGYADAYENSQSDVPSPVKQYLFAKQQGYTGSFKDWQLLASSGSSPTINITNRTTLPSPDNGEVEKLRDLGVNTRQFVNTVGDTIELVRSNPNVNTWVGKAASIVNDLQTEVGAIASSMGIDFDESNLDPSQYADVFDKLGVKNQVLRSMFTTLAYQYAMSQGASGRLSDQDIERFMQQIGASTSDPRTMIQILKNAAHRAVEGFKINWRVRVGRTMGIPVPTKGLGLELPDAQSQQQQQQQQSLPPGVSRAQSVDIGLTAKQNALVNDILGDDGGP